MFVYWVAGMGKWGIGFEGRTAEYFMDYEEDNNVNWVGCYGNEWVETPHIDRLAAEGFRYSEVYANAPVCAPSRCTWITGMYAVTMGTQPMRSRMKFRMIKFRIIQICFAQ